MDLKKPPHIEEEERVREFWKTANIFAQSVNRTAVKGDYVFYDGPPFATGTPHYGHIVASVIKDVVPRFWTMNGYRVERRWGWDCHGLPIENLVEKELGITNKQQIVEMGVKKFNELCRSKVLSYVPEWKIAMEKLGRWVDMEHDYKTMDLSFMESVWWVFKQLYNKDLIYEGYRSMYVCPRCETTLSQAEVSEGYKDIKDLSVVAKFELVDEPGTYLLAWTTTPWTLPGNVALAINPEIEYVKISIIGEGWTSEGSVSDQIKVNKIYYFILAKKRCEELLAKNGKEYQIIEEFKGTELLNKKYNPLFNYYAQDSELKNHENGWQVYPGSFVSEEEGTGIVHIAPGYGEDDLNLSKEYNLPFIQHVGMDGVMKKEVVDFAGLHVKPIEDVISTDVAVIKYLADKGLLFSKEKCAHSYPHCWRCDTPLINYATSSWFVSVTKIKDNALETAKTINWSPEYIKEGRFGNWLEGARDWSISRQRFWASVIPIWCCEECQTKKVFGSVKELEAASGVTLTDLHKHIVDEVVFACSCGGSMKRVPDVLDTWFDSGSMPYAQVHYPFEAKEKFEENFPAQFIAEGIDQTRTWFYYLHVLATSLFNKAAFEYVAVNGTVLGEDGKKMSKRLQNYPDPNVLMDNYGADALRAFLLSAPVMQAENMNFSEKGVQEAMRKNIMILWNVYAFYEMYRGSETASNNSHNILDQWIIARLYQLIQAVHKAMSDYNLPKAMRPITEFIDDLSTWYLRRSRERFKQEGDDKLFALSTTKYVLIELAKVMAPFTPFTAEALWQKVTTYNFKDDTKSVHLEMWSEAKNIQVDSLLEVLEKMDTVRQIVQVGAFKRDQAKIKIRQPLATLRYGVIANRKKLGKDYENIIADELNIKEIRQIEVSGEEIGGVKVELDTEITPELKKEGMKREIVRLVNQLRKQAAMTIEDRIKLVWWSEDPIIKTIFTDLANDLKRDTLSSEIENNKESEAFEYTVEEALLYIAIKKI